MKVESFSLDHTKVIAPFVRRCVVYEGKKGDKVAKFDLRFMQPNKEEMDMSGIHTLEHLMAEYLRDYLDGIIDLSPMGCRTGFYLTVWEDREVKDIISALEKSLKQVLVTTDVPAVNEIQCGNYREHSLEKAQEYAKKVLDKGFREDFLI